MRLSRWPQPSRWLPILVFMVFLLLALAIQFAGPYRFLTADESNWLQRTFRFAAALDRRNWDGTYRSGHPGVTVMWLGLLGLGPKGLEPFLADKYADKFELVERADGYLTALAQARTGVGVAT